MDRPLTVRDLMTERVFSVTAEDTLATVYDLMDSLHVRHIPVVEKGGALLGLISQRELSFESPFEEDEVPVSEQREQMEARKAKEIMTQGVETVSPEDPIADAGRILLENKLGCLPVVDEARLVGILTEADFVSYVVQRTEATTREKVA